MRVIIENSYADISNWISIYIKNKINNHINDTPFILGLPTGSTQLQVYKNLIITSIGHFLVHAMTMILPVILVILEKEFSVSIIDLGIFQKNWQTSEKNYLIDEI